MIGRVAPRRLAVSGHGVSGVDQRGDALDAGADRGPVPVIGKRRDLVLRCVDVTTCDLEVAELR